MLIDAIREMLDHDPFEPFRIVMSSGEAYTVRNPNLVALMRSQIFIAQPNSDKHAYVPLLHITAIERLTNGQSTARRKRRR